MAEPNSAGRTPQEPPPLYHEAGLLEEFNLPPKAIRYLRAHQRQLWTIFGLALALVLVLAGIDSYRGHWLKKGAEALDAALHAESGQREQLEKLLADYGATPSALWAEVELARLDEQAGKTEAAVSRYQAVLGKLKRDSKLEPLVLGKLAGLEENRKHWDAALGYLERLEGIAGRAPDAALAMGRIYEAQGKKAEALAMYKKFVEATAISLEESGVDQRRQMIMSHMELMQAR